MRACFKALDDGVRMAPLDSRYTNVGFNLISFKVCILLHTTVFEVKLKEVQSNQVQINASGLAILQMLNDVTFEG